MIKGVMGCLKNVSDQKRANGIICYVITVHVVRLGMSSYGVSQQPGHVVHHCMLSTGECRPLGLVVNQGMSSSGPFCPPSNHRRS